MFGEDGKGSRPVPPPPNFLRIFFLDGMGPSFVQNLGTLAWGFITPPWKLANFYWFFESPHFQLWWMAFFLTFCWGDFVGYRYCSQFQIFYEWRKHRPRLLEIDIWHCQKVHSKVLESTKEVQCKEVEIDKKKVRQRRILQSFPAGWSFSGWVCKWPWNWLRACNSWNTELKIYMSNMAETTLKQILRLFQCVVSVNFSYISIIALVWAPSCYLKHNSNYSFWLDLWHESNEQFIVLFQDVLAEQKNVLDDDFKWAFIVQICNVSLNFVFLSPKATTVVSSCVLCLFVSAWPQVMLMK